GVYNVSFTATEATKKKLQNTENYNVLDLAIDWNGQLWIATWSEGIKISKKDGTFHSLDESTGLPNNTIYKILPDVASKKMWATTNVGMVAIEPKDFSVIRYGFYDGLQGDEFNNPGLLSKNGFMYFGGINGFNRFYPNIIENKTSILEPIITEFWVANKKLTEIRKKGSEKVLSDNGRNELVLNFDETPFSIGFTSPQYIKPSDLEFRYRLVGLDDRWVISDSSSRRATYTNMDAGQYTFELQVRNINDDWGIRTVRKTIIIQPPWWLTTLAKLVYLLAIVTVLSSMFYLYWKRRQSDRDSLILRAKSEERLRLSLWGGGNEIWDWDIITGKISRSDEDSSINIKSRCISDGLGELSSYIHKFDIERVKAQLLDHLKGRTEYFESTYRIKDNELGWRWIQDRAKVVERDINGSPVRMSGTQKDVSEIQRKNEEIERLGQAFKNTSDGVWIRDSKWRLIEVNPSFEKITGFNFDEKQGEELWFPDVEGQSANIIQRIRLSLMEKGHWQGEVWAERKKKEPFPQKLTIDTILDEKGHVNYYVGVFSDITFHKRAEEEFRKLANFDSLTGLPNRACLYDRLNQTLEKTRIRKERFALFIVDIDNFKRINDSMGHTVGDTLIAEVAQRLTHCNRDGDTVARVGGDEFVIIRDDISSSNEVASFVELMLKELNSPIFAKGQKLSLNFSIGITLSPDDGTTAEKLLRNADTAMYEAKKDVQNSYHFFSVDLNKKARKRLSMENELRRAIEFDLIELAYQPKVNMETGLVDGMEALARWNSPKLGRIPPDEFIVLAEETGQIISLGAQLLRKAVAQTKQWVDAGIMKGRTSVNMSAHQFLHDDLAEQVSTILREEKLDAKYLELELTESACIQDMDKTIRQMNTLRKLGIQLALDDFGTGYSSLAQLKTLPLDTLKVDKSFIDNIQTSIRDVNVVKAIIDIARSLELDVVIEGVESQAQCDYLWQCRAKIIQGYFFSKPIDPNEMSKLLTKKWKRSSYLSKISDNVTSLG
ncbi:MAG: EAL domain-containing protein, partial [Kangiellaceae bacterium]|nr:EAL domain-containing protein [Kangiellaceae bacterium]